MYNRRLDIKYAINNKICRPLDDMETGIYVLTTMTIIDKANSKIYHPVRMIVYESVYYMVISILRK